MEAIISEADLLITDPAGLIVETLKPHADTHGEVKEFGYAYMPKMEYVPPIMVAWKAKSNCGVPERSRGYEFKPVRFRHVAPPIFS